TRSGPRWPARAPRTCHWASAQCGGRCRRRAAHPRPAAPRPASACACTEATSTDGDRRDRRRRCRARRDQHVLPFQSSLPREVSFPIAQKARPGGRGSGARIVRAHRFCSGLYRGRVDLRSPDPPLSDGVVSLRPWTLDDVPAIAAMCDETEIARWIHQIPSPYTERDAREYVLAAQAAWRDRTGAFFAVVERETGELAGSISIHVIDPEAANV